jgi:hypothetical protein
MYTTIEANLDNGRVTGPEASKLPAHAHVLITLLKTTVDMQPATYDFSGIAGRLQWKGDAVQEQRKLRDEW